jgi:hypothetical protein
VLSGGPLGLMQAAFDVEYWINVLRAAWTSSI